MCHLIGKHSQLTLVKATFVIIFSGILLLRNVARKIAAAMAACENDNLLLFFPALYNHFKLFFNFQPPVYSDPTRLLKF